MDRMPIPCDIFNSLMASGGLSVEFSGIKSNGRNRNPARQPITPFGLGLFRVWLPDASFRGNDQQWKSYLFAIPEKRERQLTLDEYSLLRNEMAKALQSEKCRKFVDTLISYNTGDHYDSEKQFLKYSDAVFKNAGIFFGGEIGGLRRNNRNDYPKIFLGPEYRLDLNLLGYAESLFHELIHGLTIGSDDAIDRDLIKLGIVPLDRKGNPLPIPKGENYDYNKYFDTAIKNACFPTLQN